jgi:RNA polymerase sigma factor (sigma-70 family)
VEASALPASVGLARTRIALGAPLLRIRSDEQLVSLFRAGNEDAFRVIHDRYRQRLFAYTRQMLAGSAQDAEDAVQEVFVRAYAGLRTNSRELALRAWLYRIAHNRCIDELRRPYPTATEAIGALAPASQDPLTRVEQRDTLRRLIADVQRLPDQQRSALLMRELGGMPYADVSGALSVSVPAVKSLLVRARVGLAQASEARDTGCAEIREDLILSHDRGVRTSGLARRHLHDCAGCREFRSEVRGVSRQLAALVPGLGPIGVIAKLLGIGGAGGSAAGSGAVASGSAAVTSGVAGTGAAASVGAIGAGASHVVTLLAAAMVTAGGAIELQRTISAPVVHHPAHHRIVRSARPAGAPGDPAPAQSSAAAAVADADPSQASSLPPPPAAGATPGSTSNSSATTSSRPAASSRRSGSSSSNSIPISEMLDPDDITYGPSVPVNPVSPTSAVTTTPGATTTPVTTTGAAGATPTSSGPTTTTTPTTTPASGVTSTPAGTPGAGTGTAGSTTAGSSTGTSGAASGKAGSTGSATTPTSTVSGDTTISSGSGAAAPGADSGAVFTPTGPQ